MESERYVICRPLGGLNDMLAQISRTLEYSRRTGRHLLVETESNPKFTAHLTKYFDCNNELRTINRQDLREFDNKSCFPNELTGRVSSYELLDLQDGAFRDALSRVPVTFDFGADYEETSIIHHQPGGGLNSIFLLDKMTLNARILAEVARRRKLLGSHYSALHIRDSDYETDWMSQVSQLLPTLSGCKVFLATDNNKIAGSDEFAKFAIDAFWSENLQDTPSNFDQNEQALIDLALLAEASELFVLRLKHSTVEYSGFSLLAKFIWSVRKVKRDGVVALLRSKSLFTDFQPAKTRLMRKTFFFLYWLPIIIRASNRRDFLGK